MTKIANVRWRFAQSVSIVGVTFQIFRTRKGFAAKQTKCSVVGFFHVDAAELIEQLKSPMVGSYYLYGL